MLTAKIKSSIVFFALALLTLNSCYKEPNWVDDNVTSEGKNYPVIAGFTLITEGDFFKVGTSVELDLDYWSIDEIKEVKLYESIDGMESSEVATFSYQSNFQDDSQTDELLMPYTINIPASLGDTVSVVLDVEVINTNGLTRNTNAGGTANRPSVTLTAVR